jgi:hypothetical protein
MSKNITAIAASAARRMWENSHRFLRPFQPSSEVTPFEARRLSEKLLRYDLIVIDELG